MMIPGAAGSAGGRRGRSGRRRGCRDGEGRLEAAVSATSAIANWRVGDGFDVGYLF